MEFAKLELFLHIVETGSLTAAARRMHVTQPAASRSLKALEDDLSVELFERVGRGLVLTAAGRALRPQAEDILQRVHETAQKVRLAARDKYFDVRIGTVDSVASRLFPDMIAATREEFEGLEVQITTARTQQLLEDVRSGKLDLVVVAMSGSPVAASVEKIGPYSMKYYGIRERFPDLIHVEQEEDLGQYPIIELKAQPGQPTLIKEDAASFARVGSMATVKSMVMGGFGVGALLDYMFSPHELELVHSANIEHDPNCGLFMVSSSQWTGEMAQSIREYMRESIASRLL